MQLIQAAEQLKIHANRYYERLRTLKGPLMRKLHEDEAAAEGDDEKGSTDRPDRTVRTSLMNPKMGIER
jgi:hypothetical protein